MKKILLLALTVFITQNLFAQAGGRQISGILKDSTGLGVIAATIKLTSPKDTLTTRSDVDGNFTFRNVKSSQFLISVSSLGFQDFNKRYLYKDDVSPLKLDPITLKLQSNLLNTVEVSGSKGVVVKQDTVEYRASDYPVRENSVAEDIIKKLPGVEVDKDGNVTTQGKSVTRVRVNGKDYFEGDLKTATQNLPAEIIEKIQVIDDYGDQAAITGIREGEADKIINIQIRPDKNKGMIANANAGGGNQERYQLVGNGQFLNNDKQLAVILNVNNTNASPFNFSGGGGRGFGGGGGRSGNFGGGGGFGGFNANGITSTAGGGLNYRDVLSKKINIFGSYRFTNRNTENFSTTNSEFLGGQDSTLFTNRISNSETRVTFHNFNFNVEYRIDSLNYLRISPSISVSNNNSDSDYDEVQSGFSNVIRENLSNSNASAPFFGGNIIYNHRFRKLGRNLSIASSLSRSENNSFQEARDNFDFYNTRPDSLSARLVDLNNVSYNTNANLTYSEPVGKYSRIDFGYNFTRASYDNSRITQIDRENSGYQFSPGASNVFNYAFTTHRYSLNYRLDRQRLYNFNVGLTAQPTLLKGFSETNKVNVHKTGLNFFPTARFAYYFGRTRSLSINYGGRSTEPSFSQLQPVTDSTDAQRPSVGNRDLQSAFTQTLNISYNSNMPVSGIFFNTGVNGNIINDRITRNIRNYRNSQDINIQETNYINADGYYSANAFYSLGKPFAERKYRISLNGNVNYTNDVTYLNSQKNIGKNWSLSQSLRGQIHPNQNVEINPSVRYTRTWLNYSLPISNDSKAQSWNFDLNGKIYFMKTFIIGFDISKNLNSGYSSIATNPLIINTYLEKQFFNRRGTFRIQGFDVTKEATSISRSISENVISDSQNNRLSRYVMATFSYRFQKFPGGIQPNFQRNRDGMRQGGGRDMGVRPE